MSPDYRWAACSASEFGHVGEKRHLVRPGALDTLCGASASHPEIWRGNTVKPPCGSCVARFQEISGRKVSDDPQEDALADLREKLYGVRVKVPTFLYGIVSAEGEVGSDLTPSLGEAENWLHDLFPAGKGFKVWKFRATALGEAS